VRAPLTSPARNRIRRGLQTVGLALGLLSGVSAAEAQQQPTGVAPPQGEQFFLRIPDGWKEVVRTRQQGADIVAYVPQEQNATQWTDMLSIQVFQGMTALPAQSFYERYSTSYRKSCETVRIGQMQTGVSNGYPSAFWIMACGNQLQAGTGETSFFRLVQGNKALYVAQRTWRTARFDAQKTSPITGPASDVAIETLKHFGLCDPSMADRPCPKGQ